MAPYWTAEVSFTMFFSDLHVQLLSRGILNPGEQLVGQTVTAYHPWWAFGFIRRQYLVLATDQRLILVDHRYSFFMPTVQRMHQVDSIAWSNCQELKVKGIFNKKLRVRGVGERGPISLTMPIPNTFFGLLAPMRNNMTGARSVAAAFSGGAQLNALQPAQQQGYAQPQMSYAPQAPQLPQQAAYGAPPPSLIPQSVPHQQASVPPQNSPGYASVPPPPVAGPYGVPQQQPQQAAAPASIPPSFGAPPRQWS